MTNFKAYAIRNPECINTHYVCDRCQLIFGHQLQYCPTCPGKMIQVKKSCRELDESYPQAEWGETKGWDEKRANTLRIIGLEKNNGNQPCLVVFWLHRSLKEAFLSRVESLEIIPSYGPAETFEENSIEYGFEFDSFTAAWEKFYSPLDRFPYQYRSRMVFKNR